MRGGLPDTGFAHQLQEGTWVLTLVSMLYTRAVSVLRTFSCLC